MSEINGSTLIEKGYTPLPQGEWRKGDILLYESKTGWVVREPESTRKKLWPFGYESKRLYTVNDLIELEESCSPTSLN